MAAKKTVKQIITSGKRKKAIARAVAFEGNGIIRVNNVPVSEIQPLMARMKLEEPILIAGDRINKLDIDAKVTGGGVMSQADAARLAISKAIVAFTKDKKLEKDYLDYDRHLLIADVRRKETRKPNSHGKARARVQKSYR